MSPPSLLRISFVLFVSSWFNRQFIFRGAARNVYRYVGLGHVPRWVSRAGAEGS
jgi:hypothetical protein